MIRRNSSLTTMSSILYNYKADKKDGSSCNSSKKLLWIYNHIDINEVASIISNALTEIININKDQEFSAMVNFQKISPFYCQVLPNISLEGYLKRIIKYTELEVSTLILASVYIDNFCEKNHFFLTKNNIFR